MSHYLIGNGVARILMKRSLLDYATEVCVQPGTKLRRLPLRKAQKLLRYASLVEHEYFHCRSTLTTTFGWVPFQVQQVMKTHKIEVLEAAPGFLSRDGSQSGPDFKIAKNHVLLSFVLQKFLNRPSANEWGILERLPCTQGEAFGKPLNRWHPCLSEVVRPQEAHLARSGERIDVQEIFEAYAVWKEYAFACSLALRGDPERFHDLTEPIIFPALEETTYRRAGDLLARAGRLGYRHALPGILFDIALSPPIQVGKLTSWDEFHPSLRLERMAEALPSMALPKWAYAPNFELLPANAYEVMDDLFAARFCWRRARFNKATLIDVLLKQRESDAEAVTSFDSGDMNAVTAGFRTMYEFWNIIALRGTQRNPMIFIQPQSGKEEEVTCFGYISQPLITVFDDEMLLNSIVVPNNQLADKFVIDAIISRYLDFMINSNEFSPPRFLEPRHMYGLAKRLAEKKRMPLLKASLGKSFDDFILRSGLNPNSAAIQALQG